MPEGALTSLTVSDAYNNFVGQAESFTSKSRSLREYLIPTNNIIVFGHFFNLKKKTNVICRLVYYLTQLFW